MMHKKTQLILFSFLILIISYFTYFRNYSYPPNLFWDENYHIASAQKYLNGVFFMEPHPPLGKMFIALGEYILHPNDQIDTSSFLTADYIKDIPQGYSFKGVRFFPTFFAFLSTLLFFLILYILSHKPALSFLFTSVYLFENAIIVHSRGAMLEGTQIFFILLFLLYFFWLVSSSLHKNTFPSYVVLGLLYGAVISIKLNGAILGLILIILLVWEYHKTIRWSEIIVKIALFVLASIIVFVNVYCLHFILAKSPLEERYSQASDVYRALLKRGRSSNPATFPLQLGEHLGFISHYEKGVPKYDACKPGENGSLPVAWPFGNKSINYRWERDGESVRYLYLQGNPMIWLIGIMGIFFAVNLVVSHLAFKTPIKNKRLFFCILSFVLLYIIYMGAMLSLERVMYLYHYFIPLILSLILAFMMLEYLFEEKLKKNNTKFYVAVLIIFGFVVAVYIFFSPLTYYYPLSKSAFQLRNWLPWWGLEPV
ncbi:hypothetical protein A2334_00755 [Candidatus Roizmanbacteria bacterium RIFOXYB2_FULL_38_10]|uniref:Polyprenol-phosphate-mannose--protein mannosyltransferase n=1 Tax=Candidatus Roizmanbacteria bacterium RIFOXYD1_FULL_38_12 TaxID=1802093 RepID=A0A1F7L1C8_9BACT|nr:MAG: hypothetical protein A3K47_04050 [Candidatus Roizmanbacteria bacterium RIFOXYA2_FULL_38_14]OGK63930.1 MAG: hypothetical protein A3K27_04050 [Candidatus Roizmanbacteria bacterium RIFOXYA1_FULL_37_12]OGK65776.1 MAG: hypothetical protein A3K38_04050 [Candidatus Roizmanbacteria bacterium RIFOXYB1_FULL_40_23]OGK68884.1 MAG: hypothetical protein A2334_00755 [Candidatus Roizmanbacteria bacterium RIFOXYB2_FULL_38_10]OGK70181.1 MAG: hypothetical protein A3K21_04055 [Candidatus Roizmanbacteria ba